MSWEEEHHSSLVIIRPGFIDNCPYMAGPGGARQSARSHKLNGKIAGATLELQWSTILRVPAATLVKGGLSQSQS